MSKKTEAIQLWNAIGGATQNEEITPEQVNSAAQKTLEAITEETAGLKSTVVSFDALDTHFTQGWFTLYGGTEQTIADVVDAWKAAVGNTNSTSFHSAYIFVEGSKDGTPVLQTVKFQLLDGGVEKHYQVERRSVGSGVNFVWQGWKSAMANKVDKVTGKGLSKNDFTDAYKNQVDYLSQSIEVSTDAELNSSKVGLFSIVTVPFRGVLASTFANATVGLRKYYEGMYLIQEAFDSNGVVCIRKIIRDTYPVTVAQDWTKITKSINTVNGQAELDAVRTIGFYINTGTLTGNTASTFGSTEPVIFEHKIHYGGIHFQIGWYLDGSDVTKSKVLVRKYEGTAWSNWAENKQIADNFTTDSAYKSLSASRGKYLYDWLLWLDGSNANKADKLSTEFTIKANPTSGNKNETDYDCFETGIGLLGLDSKAQIREYIEGELLSEGYQITSSNSTVILPSNTSFNNRYVLITQSSNSIGNHIVKLPNCNKTTRFLVQVLFTNSLATDITVKDINNNTVCVFPNPKDSTVYPYVDVIVNSAGSAENWNEHNIIGAKIDSAKTNKELLENIGSQPRGRATFSKSAYTMKDTDSYIGQIGTYTPGTDTPGSTTVSLVSAASVAAGTMVTVCDESFSCRPWYNIAITPNGSETINGLNKPVYLNYHGQTVVLVSNGVNGWTVINAFPQPNANLIPQTGSRKDSIYFEDDMYFGWSTVTSSGNIGQAMYSYNYGNSVNGWRVGSYSRGVLQFGTTQALNTSYNSLFIGGVADSGGNLMRGEFGTMWCEWRLRQPAISNTNYSGLRVGIQSGSSSDYNTDSVDGVYWEFTTQTNANLRRKTANNNTRTNEDSGIALSDVATDEWIHLCVEWDATGGKGHFFYGKVSASNVITWTYGGTVTTNVPATTRSAHPAFRRGWLAGSNDGGGVVAIDRVRMGVIPNGNYSRNQ